MEMNKAAIELNKRLQKLVEDLPYLKLQYWYEEDDLTHMIYVEPYSHYQEDKHFLARSEKIEDDMFDMFPYDGVYFISENSVLPVPKDVVVIQGKLYGFNLSKLEKELAIITEVEPRKVLITVHSKYRKHLKHVHKIRTKKPSQVINRINIETDQTNTIDANDCAGFNQNYNVEDFCYQGAA